MVAARTTRLRSYHVGGGRAPLLPSTRPLQLCPSHLGLDLNSSTPRGKASALNLCTGTECARDDVRGHACSCNCCAGTTLMWHRCFNLEIFRLERPSPGVGEPAAPTKGGKALPQQKTSSPLPICHAGYKEGQTIECVVCVGVVCVVCGLTFHRAD